MDDWTTDQTLIQGSDAWRAARRRRVGGSDIGVILRMSKYKTRRELWEEMTGRREVPNIGALPHVMRGTLAEPIARGMLERELGVKYATPVLVHPVHAWAVASFDGVTTDHTLEIKTMSAKAHAAREITPAYRAQCLWGLAVSGKARCLFASYRPEDGTLWHEWIMRDPEWEVEALARAAEFMEWVESDAMPEEYVYVG